MFKRILGSSGVSDEEQQNLNQFGVGEFDASTEMNNVDELTRLKLKLEYFFMDPIKKWKKKNTRPWKLLIQILKIVLSTWQLILFGTDVSNFMTYKDDMQITFKQLFLKDWDPSSESVIFPRQYAPYAVYTQSDFYTTINHAIKEYSNVTNSSVGPFRYQSNSTVVVSPIEYCLKNYLQADFDRFKYNYSTITATECKFIDNYAPAGDFRWNDFDFKAQLKHPINFETMISTELTLPLRTLTLWDRTSNGQGVVCFNIDVKIDFDNQNRDGQIAVRLTSKPRRVTCYGQFKSRRDDILIRQVMNTMVLIFCILSFGLCTRSIWRAFKLVEYSDRVLKTHNRTLSFRDRLEFVDAWLIIIIINDVLVISATTVITLYGERLLEINDNACSLLLGIGNLLTWSGLLRYLSFFKKYNLLIMTLRKSFLHVTRFMLCTMLIYCGFCFCGWVVFGPYHPKFREISTTTECLFSLINGDDMFETFVLLKSEMNIIWWFSRIYLYLFISLFIYVILSLFIALIMDTYEVIKQFRDNGFPKTRLEIFYRDGDLSKLKSLVESTNIDDGHSL